MKRIVIVVIVLVEYCFSSSNKSKDALINLAKRNEELQECKNNHSEKLNQWNKDFAKFEEYKQKTGYTYLERMDHLDDDKNTKALRDEIYKKYNSLHDRIEALDKMEETNNGLSAEQEKERSELIKERIGCLKEYFKSFGSSREPDEFDRNTARYLFRWIWNTEGFGKCNKDDRKCKIHDFKNHPSVMFPNWMGVKITHQYKGHMKIFEDLSILSNSLARCCDAIELKVGVEDLNRVLNDRKALNLLLDVYDEAVRYVSFVHSNRDKFMHGIMNIDDINAEQELIKKKDEIVKSFDLSLSILTQRVEPAKEFLEVAGNYDNKMNTKEDDLIECYGNFMIRAVKWVGGALIVLGGYGIYRNRIQKDNSTVVE